MDMKNSHCLSKVKFFRDVPLALNGEMGKQVSFEDSAKRRFNVDK